LDAELTRLRQSLALGRPASEPAVSWPEPVGPAVVVSGETATEAGAAEPAPGASPLDAELTRLRQSGLLPEEGGAS
jgi:hypothetical protein